MIEKTFYFLAKLPESGNDEFTKLVNHYTNATTMADSPLLELLAMNEQIWINNPSVIANRFNQQRTNISDAIISGFWDHVTSDVIIENSNNSLAHIETVAKVFNTKPKIIMLVRDIPSILSTLMTTVNLQEVDSALMLRDLSVTHENRVEYLWKTRVSPILSLFLSHHEKNKDMFLLIEYDNLVRNPNLVMDRLCKFCDIENLHGNLSPIQLTQSDPKEVLGKQVYEKYATPKLHAWRYK